MSRAQRLLDLLQALRRRRRPVRGQILADELGISLRTLYRDIGALQAQGAAIEGEAGVGYILRPGFTLPPLMFTHRMRSASLDWSPMRMVFAVAFCTLTAHSGSMSAIHKSRRSK